MRAASEHGDVFALGAGMVADHDPAHPDQDGLSLTRSAVSGNVGVADGHTAIGRGGGIYDAVFPEGPFGAPLSLTDSAVTHNALLGGIREGGGADLCGPPLSRSRSAITGNLPDQLFRCPATASRAAKKVSEGTRTPDRLDHNQELYQLSYAHHGDLRGHILTARSGAAGPR